MKNIIRGFIINSLKRCEMLVFKTYFSPSNGAKARPWDFSTKVGLQMSGKKNLKQKK